MATTHNVRWTNRRSNGRGIVYIVRSLEQRLVQPVESLSTFRGRIPTVGAPVVTLSTLHDSWSNVGPTAQCRQKPRLQTHVTKRNK